MRRYIATSNPFISFMTFPTEPYCYEKSGQDRISVGVVDRAAVMPAPLT